MGTDIKKGTIFDIKRFAVDDGPGIRTTIFLKGCHLRCWWCHNPEGQLSKPELMHRRNLCDRCGECIDACPKNALMLGAKRLAIDRNICDLCGRCAQQCPTGALAIAGKEMNTSDVMEEVIKDLAFYEESGGGVTISGGEPLVQIGFLDAILDECRKESIHTAVDTSGYAPRQTLKRISDKTDLFLYDIKTMDDGKHRKFTGGSNKQILSNLRWLAEDEGQLLVRFPIVPKINDDESNVSKTGKFIASCGIERICLLPYHRSGTEKYRGLGRSYRLAATPTPPDRKLQALKRQLEAFGLAVTIGG